MKEMEVKVLHIDKSDIEKKLINLGAKLVKKEYQTNIIFDTTDRKIKRDHQGYLRIREIKNLITDRIQYKLTLKKNISKSEIRENLEYETLFDNKEALMKILECLDLAIKHEGTKERVSYRYENLLFEIDTWDQKTYPDTYLEIEVQNKVDMDRAIKLLDLDRKNVTSKSLEQLRIEKGLGDL